MGGRWVDGGGVVGGATRRRWGMGGVGVDWWCVVTSGVGVCCRRVGGGVVECAS